MNVNSNVLQLLSAVFLHIWLESAVFWNIVFVAHYFSVRILISTGSISEISKVTIILLETILDSPPVWEQESLADEYCGPTTHAPTKRWNFILTSSVTRSPWVHLLPYLLIHNSVSVWCPKYLVPFIRIPISFLQTRSLFYAGNGMYEVVSSRPIAILLTLVSTIRKNFSKEVVASYVTMSLLIELAFTGPKTAKIY